MAQRRSLFGQLTPASPMTPKGGSGMMYGNSQHEQSEGPIIESSETFRRRTTPVVGPIEKRPTTLQEVLAMLNGGQ